MSAPSLRSFPSVTRSGSLCRQTLLRLGVLCLLVLAAAACTPQPAMPPLTPANPAQAAANWQAFTAYSQARTAASGPFRLQCSLRYDDQGEGNRATAVIWGNGSLPVRLDVMAGIGMLIARISQTSQDLVIHSPREDKAWVHRGQGKAFLAFKVPIPLAVSDFIAVLDGRFLDVIGAGSGTSPMDLGQGSIRYSLHNSTLPGTITLNAQGLLTEWQEAPGAWVMSVSYDDAALPERIEISHPEGRQVVLQVKERTKAEPFTTAQLRLDLPPQTRIQSLQQAIR